MLLTDEVGLGKTYSGLLNLLHEDALPALIVPPAHLPPRWAEELDDSFPFLTYHVAKKMAVPLSITQGNYPDVLIVPYSKLDGWAPYLAGDMASVVFDEAQELRHGASTLKGRAAAQVADAATFVQGLTATPIHNYGGEIWNLYNIIAPDELGSREEFAREWGSDGGGIRVADPEALGAWLRDQGLMLRRTRKEVGSELPKTVKVVQDVESDYAALADVAKVSQHLAEIILSSTSTPSEKMQASGQLDMETRRATGVDKAPYVADYVRMLLESEQRIVLWGWHRDVYDIWLERLADFHPVMYTGSETPKRKADSFRAFTTPIDDEANPLESAARILIMSLRSGAGTDGLQKVCGVGVFGELDWSPAVHEQAIGRLHRDEMGTDPVVAYFLVSAEGTDPLLQDVLQLKRQQSEPMISGDGKLLANTINDSGRGKLLAEQILGRRSASNSHNRTSTEGRDNPA
jgi:SNF2 family DNA or RNA helicase